MGMSGNGSCWTGPLTRTQATMWQPRRHFATQSASPSSPAHRSCFSLDMVRLDLVTHRVPPLRYLSLPAFLDAALVTAPAIARSLVAHRTTDLSNAGCAAHEQTTGVGSISAGPIPPSAPPACCKYRCCGFEAVVLWSRGCAA